jgi:hypothetical protein
VSCIALVAVVKRQMAESREPGRRQVRAHLKLSTAGKTGRKFFNTWLVAKSRRVQLNSKFSRSNSSNKKAEGQGSRISLVSENTDFAETYYYP